MTSTVLAPDTYGVDAAGFAHLASFANVRTAGYEFVSLYVGGNFGVNRTVVERAWAAGLQVQLNYERSATAGLGGAALGTFQAREGIQQSLDLGWLKESPLVWSPVDFSIQASQFDVVDAYHQALVDVCRAEEVTGGSYGPPFYLRHLAAQSWWPDDFVLWQWAGAGWIEPWTWAKQVFAPTHDVSRIGVSVDENVTVRPYPFWSGYGPDKNIPVPPDQEIDMPALFKSDDAIHWPGSATLAPGDYPPNNGIVFTLEAGAVRHVPYDEFQTYGDLHYPVVAVPGMRLKGMIDAGGVYSKNGTVAPHTHSVTGSTGPSS